MNKMKYNTEELDARLRFVVGATLATILLVSTLAILYALVFVTQPIGAQAENDKMFFGVLSSIATFITGALAGILLKSSTSRESSEEVVESKEIEEVA